jgi:hypothetical protein
MYPGTLWHRRLFEGIHGMTANEASGKIIDLNRHTFCPTFRLIILVAGALCWRLSNDLRANIR